MLNIVVERTIFKYYHPEKMVFLCIARNKIKLKAKAIEKREKKYIKICDDGISLVCWNGKNLFFYFAKDTLPVYLYSQYEFHFSLVLWELQHFLLLVFHDFFVYLNYLCVSTSSKCNCNMKCVFKYLTQYYMERPKKILLFSYVFSKFTRNTSWNILPFGNQALCTHCSCTMELTINIKNWNTNLWVFLSFGFLLLFDVSSVLDSVCHDQNLYTIENNKKILHALGV